MRRMGAAIGRVFNPPPAPEAVAVQQHSQELMDAARRLRSEHADVFGDMVRSMRKEQQGETKPRPRGRKKTTPKTRKSRDV
jgi:hypothetical protein